MHIYNSQLDAYIAICTGQEPDNLSIPKPAKQPYLQITLPNSLKSSEYFKHNFSKIMSHGYSSSEDEKLIIAITGAKKIVHIIHFMCQQRSYRHQQKTQEFIELKQLAQTLASQVIAKQPPAKSKNIEDYNLVEE